MSAPRAIAQLVVDGIRITGKAFAAAGRQAMANARHRPEADATPEPSSGGGSKSLTADLAMSLEEAHLILNVKKEDSMETILSNYERIFKANGPPEPPKETKKEAVGGKAQPVARNARERSKTKGVTHSHYLQSKVYRALERIKAERADEPAEVVVAEGAAAETAEGAAPAEGAAEAKKEESK